MSKLLLTLLLSSFILTSVPLIAGSDKNNDREEMRELRAQQAKLHSKERLIRLKTELNLTKEQQSAWAKYEAHAMENSGKRRIMSKRLRKSKADNGSLPTGLELAEANVSRLEQNLSSAKNQLHAFSALYQVLNKEHRTTIDKLTRKRVRSEAKRVRRDRPTKLNREEREH